ncbi:hypothetical protein HPP92_012544 [Vanilla planifolia]|uniref:Uncharacterized protein n=1 Tax=Vanilla planifolia TaxID=51239 RepID=A0A835QX72_VANPL|nr:hypothetical protein HPP92_012544 [Vanilla planifolia]
MVDWYQSKYSMFRRSISLVKKGIVISILCTSFSIDNVNGNSFVGRMHLSLEEGGKSNALPSSNHA